MMYSQKTKQDSLNFAKLREANHYKEKVLYFKEIKGGNESEMNEILESYFIKELEKNKNNLKNTIYIKGLLSVLYARKKEYQKAIYIAKSIYFVDENFEDKDFLCFVLSSLDKKYGHNANIVDLSFLIRRMTTVCNKENSKLYHLYSKLAFYDLAIENYRKYHKLKSSEYQSDKYELGKHQNNIGWFFLKKNNLDSAFYYLNKSLKTFNDYKKEDKIAAENNDLLPLWLSFVHVNLGVYYYKTNQPKKAISLIKEEQRLRTLFESTPEEDKNNKIKYYRNMSTCYISLKEYPIAKKYLDSLTNLEDNYEVSKLKGDYFKGVRNVDSLAYYFDKLSTQYLEEEKIQIKESHIATEKFLMFEEDINKQYKAIIYAEKEIEEKGKLLKIFIVFTIIFSILALVLLTLNKQKQQQKKLISNQKNIIEESLKEKKVLLRELHHRVKNNMQMISSMLRLEANKLEDIEIKTTFESAINRIIVLSKIHNNLYTSKNLSKVSLNDYVKEISEYLVTALDANKNVKLEFNITPKTYIHTDRIISLGIIINELITNSFKYAFNDESKENVICISLLRKSGNIMWFNYKDNGVGFDLGDALRHKKRTSGIKLISRIINQLGGKEKIITNNGMDLSFEFIEKN